MKPATPGETLIGAGTVLSGDVVFSGGLRVDGEVRGNVRSLGGSIGTLVIGLNGRVEGNIKVTRLIVNGLVTGRVDADQFIRLQSNARLYGDLEYTVAEIHSGAVVKGRLLQRQYLAAIGETTEPEPAPHSRLDPAPVSL
jgi:cytoskeletal protein CcmA (bactofilin family)